MVFSIINYPFGGFSYGFPMYPHVWNPPRQVRRASKTILIRRGWLPFKKYASLCGGNLCLILWFKMENMGKSIVENHGKSHKKQWEHLYGFL